MTVSQPTETPSPSISGDGQAEDIVDAPATATSALVVEAPITASSDSQPPRSPPRWSRTAQIWAAVVSLALLAGMASVVVYASQTTQSTGCGALQLTANVPSPLYAGMQFKYKVVTGCDVNAYVRILQTGSNPTYQSGTDWGTPDNLNNVYVTWEENTQGLSAGTYSYVAQLRVVGSRRVVTSPMFTFTIVRRTPQAAPTPTPFDVGNPANNDSALDTATYKYCDYYGWTSSECETDSIIAVDNAEVAEGLSTMTLPTNFWSLPYDQQQFILVNEERVLRDLPPI